MSYSANYYLDELRIQKPKKNTVVLDFWIKNNRITWIDQLKYIIKKLIPFIKSSKTPDLKGLKIKLPDKPTGSGFKATFNDETILDIGKEKLDE